MSIARHLVLLDARATRPLVQSSRRLTPRAGPAGCARHNGTPRDIVVASSGCPEPWELPHKAGHAGNGLAVAGHLNDSPLDYRWPASSSRQASGEVIRADSGARLSPDPAVAAPAWASTARQALGCSPRRTPLRDPVIDPVNWKRRRRNRR